MANGPPKTSAKLLLTAERRAVVLQLRKAGATYEAIATTLKAKYGYNRLPKGWDSRYAYKDVARELKRLRTDMAIDTKAILTMELERLDTLMMAIWARSVGGDLEAMDRVLSIMARRAKLLGLDSMLLRIEADWQGEALEKGLNPDELFEWFVKKHMGKVEGEELPLLGEGKGEKGEDNILEAEYQELEPELELELEPCV